MNHWIWTVKYIRCPDSNVAAYYLGSIVYKGTVTKLATSRNFEDVSDKFNALYGLCS